MRRITLFIAAIAITLFASVTFAQTTSGDLVGTVRDPSGATIANASVTVTNEATGVAVTVKSGSAGEFRASNLLPGSYELAVTSQGFQPYTLHGLTVELNKTSTSNVTLSVGAASATVEVSAEAGVALDTTSTNLTQTFSNTELTDLPSTSSGGSTGFGVLNASLLSPGVASTGGIGIGIGPSIGGQRPRNNNFTIEGIDNNNKAVTGPLVYVPNDAVENFTLITNQFSPEFGHSSGGQFNTNVISGTNKFHGRVYEYFQNRNLNAVSGTSGRQACHQPALRQQSLRRTDRRTDPSAISSSSSATTSATRSDRIQLSSPASRPLPDSRHSESLGATYGFNANQPRPIPAVHPGRDHHRSNGGPHQMLRHDQSCGNLALERSSCRSTREPHSTKPRYLRWRVALHQHPPGQLSEPRRALLELQRRDDKHRLHHLAQGQHPRTLSSTTA